jgi:hypothetical protein
MYLRSSTTCQAVGFGGILMMTGCGSPPDGRNILSRKSYCMAHIMLSKEAKEAGQRYSACELVCKHCCVSMHNCGAVRG